MKKLIAPFLFILLLFQLTFQSLSAQSTAEVMGIVSNDEGEPIPNVSVALTKPDDESIIRGSVTDESGAFTLAIEPGSYEL